MKLKESIKQITDLQRKKNYKKALNLLNVALSLYPENDFLKKYEIFLLYKSGKNKEAFNLANNQFEYFKNDPFFLQTYFSILEKLKDKTSIKELVNKILIELPQFNKKFYEFLANVIMRNFQMEEANNLIKKLPYEISIQQKFNYKAYKEKFKNLKTDEAIDEIENLMILPAYKNDFDLNLYLAELYKKAKRYNDALNIYKSLLLQKETTFLYKMIGFSYYRLKDYKNALKYLKNVILKSPDDTVLIQTIYKIFEKDKDFEGFKLLIEEVLAKYPEMKKLYGYLKRAEKWEKS